LEVSLIRRCFALLIPSLTTVLVFANAGPAASRDAFVKVDEQNFHIEISGTFGPTVVFEAGLGNDSTTWKLVAGPIAQFARVVLYDRAGLGQSLPLKNKNSAITAEQVVTDLHSLLSAADIRPPFILVGHSLGGLYMQMFARKYPGDVSGAVLLDSASPNAPSELKTRARLEPGTPAYLEEEGVLESNRQVANGGPFPSVPLTVVAATDHGPYFKKWEPTLLQLQRELAILSPQGTLVVASGSGHDVQIDRPDTVIDVIRQMAGTVQATP
jgi:pimeloyl-ACP methyl ester carboxylesterase